MGQIGEETHDAHQHEKLVGRLLSVFHD
jgi:hypothetical protein